MTTVLGLMKESAVPLRGGRLTAGVVRIENTVRRPRTHASPFVARLLRHFEAVRFDGAPLYLGIDDADRDVLSFVEGEVVAKFRTLDDHQVAMGGRLLRAFHDATRGTSLSGSRPVVCHGDPGPNNVVFRNGEPIAFIDFDTVAPGEPLTDLGYMAWTWCISSKDSAPPPQEQAQQIRVLADSYGLRRAQRKRLIDFVLHRQRQNAMFWYRRRISPPVALDGPPIAQRIEWSHREHDYTAMHRRIFASALA